MKRRNDRARKDLSEAITGIVIDASSDDLLGALSEAGLRVEHLAAHGRAVASAAKSRATLRIAETARAEQQERMLHEGFKMLVRLLRRREQLSEQELAEQACVEIDEIRGIEGNDSYVPSPRTLIQLEHRFKLPPRTLVKLVGLMPQRSSQFTEEVMRFAANAKDMGSLTRAERKLVNAFVRFVVSQGDHDK